MMKRYDAENYIKTYSITTKDCVTAISRLKILAGNFSGAKISKDKMGKYYAVARGMNPGIYQSLVSRQCIKIHAFIHCSKRLNYDVIVTL